MAESGGSLELSSAFGKVAARGEMVFVVVALVVLAGVTVWDHHRLTLAHERMECLVNLHLYTLILRERNQPLTWHNIPAEFYPCIHKSFVKPQ
jgi:hypothetical protein